MKHPHASSMQIFCGQNSKTEETFAERLHRISQREFCDSHQANPALVESLLLAANLGPENLYQSTQRILTIEGILSLTIFSKKKKWLCSWGPELIDETHRLSNFSVPVIIEQKIWKIIFGSKSASYPIPREEFLRFLSDPAQRWERIILPEYNPAYFELLRLHPCEELRLLVDRGSGHDLTPTDLENIAECKTIRVFDMDYSSARPEDMAALQRLQKLQKVILSKKMEAIECIEALMQVPNTTSIQINSSSNGSPFISQMFPFADNEIELALSFISDGRNTAREIYLYVTTGPIILAALAQCTQVESLSVYEVDPKGTNNHLSVLFMSPQLQQTVRHIRIGFCTVSDEAIPSL